VHFVDTVIMYNKMMHGSPVI